MSFLRPSVAFTQFIISEEIPRDFWGTFADRLAVNAFIDIDATASEYSCGWVSFDDMLDNQFLTPYTVGEYIVFSLRIDTRKVPPAIFKKYYTMKLKEEEEAIEKQGKRFISKDRKQELRELVKSTLLMRILPLPAYFNVVWSLKKNIIYFASTQKRIVQIFSDKFMESFALSIELISPLQQAYSLLPKESHSILENLQATDFSRNI